MSDDSSRRTSTLRWQGLSGSEREHLVLSEDETGIVAESVYMTSGGSDAFGAWYRVVLDEKWNTLEFELRVIGDSRTIHMLRDATSGRWRDADGTERSDLDNANDIDISITPFTNTIPLRRLKMRIGESVDINVCYVALPELRVFADVQRYTRLDDKRYHFDSVDSSFNADIEVDEHSLVTFYPGLFTRIV